MKSIFSQQNSLFKVAPRQENKLNLFNEIAYKFNDIMLIHELLSRLYIVILFDDRHTQKRLKILKKASFLFLWLISLSPPSSFDFHLKSFKCLNDQVLNNFIGL